MGTKAIFKIYNEGKFVIGSWIKYDGGITTTSVFPYVIKSLTSSNKQTWFNKLNNFNLFLSIYCDLVIMFNNI